MELLPNYHEILDDDEYYDITIEVGNDVKVFCAHIVINGYFLIFFLYIIYIKYHK